MSENTTTVQDSLAEQGQAPARRRATFNTLPVSEIRRLTADAVEVTFAVPELSLIHI